jgi:hypothetical protein
LPFCRFQTVEFFAIWMNHLISATRNISQLCLMMSDWN